MYFLSYQLIGCKIHVIVAKKPVDFLPMGITLFPEKTAAMIRLFYRSIG
jgi:hypothetical protein